MSDGQAWAASFISTSKSKERGMEGKSYKSSLRGSTTVLNVFSSREGGDVTLDVIGSFSCVDISPADAYDLGKRLIEHAKQHGVVDEPQPRRPDEVGVIGDLPSEWPAWPLNGEWGEVGQRPDREGVWEREGARKPKEPQSRRVMLHCNNLWTRHLDSNAWLLPVTDSVYYNQRWRYLRPLDEPQEAKPQLIDVAETLMLAVRHLRHEVEWLIERTGADTDRVEHVERLVDQAHDALAKLREVSKP